MSATRDDYYCFIFGLCLLLTWVVQHRYGRRLQVTWLNSLARFYRLYALLCQTKGFLLASFLCLKCKDVCSAIKTRIIEKLISPTAFEPAPTTFAPMQEQASVNAQLLLWMTEDAENVWKQKMESRDAKLQQIQDARAAFRASTEEDFGEGDVCYEENKMMGASNTGGIAARSQWLVV